MNDGDEDGAAEPEWYHTIELRPGVVTPGWFDTRRAAGQLPWPDLRGKRCLDVGTFDGFWAFHMERLGAAEVVAVDILDPTQWDWPPIHDAATVAAIGARKRSGDGFTQAAAALGSSVKRRELSVYDLDPAEIGRFDFVYFGSLLLHLRDPILGLMRARDVLADDGRLLLVDAIDLEMTVRHPRAAIARLEGAGGRPWWWRPNLAGLRQMALAAGFGVVDGPRRFTMPPGPERHRASWSQWRALLGAGSRQEFIESRYGDPHAWLLLSRG